MGMFIKGTNIRVVGLVESIPAIADVIGLRPDGSPIYDGGSRIDWKGQTPKLTANGGLIWLGVDGTEHPDVDVEERE